MVPSRIGTATLVSSFKAWDAGMSRLLRSVDVVLPRRSTRRATSPVGALRFLVPLIVRGVQKRADPLPKGCLIVGVKQRHGIAHRVAPKHALVQHLPAAKALHETSHAR